MVQPASKRLVTEGSLQDPSSPAGALLLSVIEDTVGDSFAPVLELGLATKPLYIAHRGGPLVHGEESREAYQDAALAGFAIEPDVQITSDGVLVCCHDATTGRTMRSLAGGGSVAVNSITADQFVNDYVVNPAIAGAPYETPVRLSDLFDLWGGRVPILPEMKDTATRLALVAMVKARGLQKAVILTSFNYADVQYSAAQGIPSMFVSDSATPATLLADGIGYVCASTAASQAYLNSCVAAGLKVVLYGALTKGLTDYHLDTTGVLGVYVDDPWWISGRYKRSVSDPFREAKPWPHMVTIGNRFSVAFTRGGVGWITEGATGGVAVAQDWVLPLPTGKARVYFTVEFLAASSEQTRWFGLAFGQIPAELPYTDTPTAGQSVLHALMRREGKLQLYSSVPDGVVLHAETVTAQPLAAVGRPATHRMMFERTATSVTLRDLDTGEQATFADTTYIYPYARISLNWNGTDAVVKDVLVQAL